MSIWMKPEIAFCGSDTTDHSTQQEVYSALISWRRRQHLTFAGYSEAEILRLGDLGKFTNEQMSELMHSNKPEAIEKTGGELNKKAPQIPRFSDNLDEKHVLMR